MRSAPIFISAYLFKMNSKRIIGGLMLGAGVWYLMKQNAPVKQFYSGNADFIKKMLPYAKAAESSTGVPAIVSLIFAAIESGYGKHAPGNNYYGIKANSTWQGEITKQRTPECMPNENSTLNAEILQRIAPNGVDSFAACNNRNDYTYWINDKFRAYPNAAASVMDFANFLRTNKNYAGAFQYTNDPKQFGAYVLTHGYATAQYVPTFLSLMDIIQKHIDTEA